MNIAIGLSVVLSLCALRWAYNRMSERSEAVFWYSVCALMGGTGVLAVLYSIGELVRLIF